MKNNDDEVDDLEMDDSEGNLDGHTFANESSQSKLSSHADPFAPREGKTLVWKDINMTLASKGDEPARKLLTDVWGEVPKRETTAVSACLTNGDSDI